MDPTSASGGDDSGLSSHVFITVVSSVGGAVLVIALVMICGFSCLCYHEYRKRRAQMQKNSDRVGLLRSRAEEDEILSDQENEMKEKETQDDETEFLAAKPEKKSPVLSSLTKRSARVTPEQSTPPMGTRASKTHQDKDQGSSGSPQNKPHPQNLDSGQGGVADEGGSKDEVSYTMIDDSGDEEETKGAPGGGDDGDKDTLQLIQTSKPQKKKRKTMDLETKAQLMGRSIAYVESLSRSSPLDAKAIASLPPAEIAAQYKSVPTNSVTLPDQPAAEREKNRYRNVLPNPYSAVSLKFTGAEASTYINANFIKGLHGEEKSYIATQGPMFETMSDFWRMAWEQDVSILVMLTNLIENGRHKCVKYWPPAGGKDTIVYGDIEVTRIKEEEVPSCYLHTQLSVKNMKTDEKRTVHHFWCIAWPDFGIPKVAEPILKLRKAVDDCRTGSSHAGGPIVVHCSAGLGRSGTFIAIDIGIQQYQEEGVVDPLKYLCEMRQDRGGMIQTQDQYAFVHQALAEYIN